MYVCMYVRMYVPGMYVCMHICMYVCMYVCTRCIRTTAAATGKAATYRRITLQLLPAHDDDSTRHTDEDINVYTQRSHQNRSKREAGAVGVPRDL